MFLRNEEEETIIVTRGGGLTFADGFEDSEKDRPRELRGSPPRRIGNAIRARSRVVGVGNRKDNIVEERRREERGIDLFSIRIEKGLAFNIGGGRRARGPDLGPETTSNLRFPSVVTNRRVRRVRTQGRDASSSAGEFVLDRGDRVSFGRWGRRGLEEELPGGLLKPVVVPNSHTESN